MQESFAPQLDAMKADPSRLLDAAELEQIYSPTEALASVEGTPALIDSSVPLRAPGADGKLGKVDLGLEATADGYMPANPLVDLRLPADSGGSISIGDQGLELRLLDADPKSGASLSPSGSLFAPEAAEDTSLLLTPISAGLELSAMLTSRRSPEQLAFEVNLSAGSELRAAGNGGAEVVGEKGQVLYGISSPRAFDAQGTVVPIAMKVDGNQIVLQVSHRDLDIAYPLLVDPEITENWSNFTDTSKLNFWSWQYSGVGAEDYIGKREPIVTNWGNGLYVRSRSSFTYPGGSYGRWWLGAPNSTAYFRFVSLGPIHYDPHGCTANEPHPYLGVWNDGGYWEAITNAYPSGYISSFANGTAFKTGSRTIFVAIGAAANANIKCGHDYALNGATLYLTDPENPTVSSPGGIPSGWIKQETPLPITVPVSDPGLGVKSAKVTSEAGESTQTLGCTGHFGSTCPPSNTFTFNLSAASFKEGERTASFSATDALGNFSNTQTSTLRIDRTKPGVILDNQLAEATEEVGGEKAEEEDEVAFDPLHLPVYNVTIEATDGSNANATTKRSGVKSVELFLDKGKTPLKTWSNASCSASSCSLTATYALKLNELGAEVPHTLRVLVSDFAGNAPREREIGFEYVPATGEKDEYVMQRFPLFDTEAEPEEGVEATGPELAVNLMNGNLVFHQKDVEVAGPAADLEVERFYNSLLPEGQNTEWGDGWTLAQTPELEVEESESGPGEEATVVEESGAVESQVALPASTGEERFDPALQATIAKEPGGYSLTDETGESAGVVQFAETGQASELETGDYSGVEYDYAGGELAEIAVEDAASAGVDPAEAARREELGELAPRFLSASGTTGSGNGQFKVLNDVAIDPTDGTLWVSDDENDRIQHLDATGTYIGQFPSCQDPGSVIAEGAGNLYVACSSTDVVRKYSDTGTTLKTITSGSGKGNGQVRFPLDLALDSGENLWVADTENDRVEEFSAAGTFLKAFAVGSRPWGIAVGPDGKIWVSERTNTRVSAYDQSGNLIHRFGSPGSGQGQFALPSDVEVDSHGYVWVADAVNNRIQVLNEEGEFITSLGSKGTGEGQLETDWWLRLALDAKGNVYVTDQGNHRLERWRAGNYFGAYKSASGTTGSGNGQFKVLNDVAIDPTDGTLWVSDDENDRIQHLDATGTYIGQFPSCQDPGSVIAEGAGNLYVACSSTDVVRKYSDTGTTLKTITSGSGKGNGQVRFPLDLALDSGENLWVADTENDRVEEFSAAGTFLKAFAVGSRPWGIAVGPDGKIWVSERTNTRVSAYDQSGNLIHRFGSPGSGQGQFALPSDVEVDSHGYVWVADAVNNRIQVLNEEGEFITSLGSKGTGEGQLETDWWLRLALDAKGNVYVTDQGNHRLERWRAPGITVTDPGVPMQDDPSLDVEVAEGLVEGVEGEQAGTVEYEHAGELLTAVDGEEGETSYEYDAAGHMTKVELPDGSWAEISYEAAYGRVKSVTVSIKGGTAKTTSFEYTDSPSRSTRVVPSGGAATVYDMAADGSFIRWQNAAKAPEIEDLAGTLTDPERRETANPIEPGVYTLEVKGHSDEGIAKIEVIANNNLQVDEKTCEENFEKPGVECATVSDQWVTETGNWPPGILYLEAIVTDREGHQASERFWVNIPYTPPPDPEAEAPPTYSEIKAFREEFGLDLDLKGDEEAINDRIFALMSAWNNPHTPAGEVARATSESFGVPLRQVDVAELDYREWYSNHDLPLIHAWGESHYPGSFAGAYLDNPGGGLVRVGFTQEQASRLIELENQLQLWAPSSRMFTFATPPTSTLAQLKADFMSIDVATEPGGSLVEQVTDFDLDEASNLLKVGAHDVSDAESTLQSLLGANPPVTIYQQDRAVEYLAGRNRAYGRILAGDELISPIGGCTANFGAWEDRTEKSTGEPVRARFALTAGHCARLGEMVERSAYPHFQNPGTWTTVGPVNRTAFEVHHWSTDAEAIRVKGGLAPSEIYLRGHRPKPVKAPSAAYRNQVLCFSGVTTDRTKCKEVIGRKTYRENGFKERMYALPFNAQHGDSGSPVWNRDTGAAVGIVSARDPRHPGITYVAPLLRIPDESLKVSPGALRALSLDENDPNLHLIVGH